MSTEAQIDALLAECEREAGRFEWEGTFADYLRLVIGNPSLSSLSHKLVYDAIASAGIDELPSGQPVYGLFENEIFGMDAALERIVQHLASGARRLETRKRILLLIGPPASGKSSIVALIKRAVEQYTCTDQGAVYAIKGCPMQEEPLHLIPSPLRPRLFDSYGIYIEGHLCPRCRYVLRKEYNGKISDVPVARVNFSEQEAVGIGYFVASNPSPSDSSLLVGSIDTSRLEGDRVDVAGQAFRLDGEFNVANRGLIELVEIFKADGHLLTTLLGLAQEQLVKMERFGSIYADEVIIGHSNQGDFDAFKADEGSEALKDRIIEIRVPYNLNVTNEVQIYRNMLKSSSVIDVHLPPLTLPTMSTFSVMSRLEPTIRQGMSMIDKLRLYDGQMVPHYSRDDVEEMKRHSPAEGMTGISPRYVMNRLSTVCSAPEIRCISPLQALHSLWQGLSENVSVAGEEPARHINLVKETVDEYSERAIREVQKAYEERFDERASRLLSSYLNNVGTYTLEGGGGRRTANERDLRHIEKTIGISERDRDTFRREIHQFFSNLTRRSVPFDYTSEPRIKAAIEASLFEDRTKMRSSLTRPRLARHLADWATRRGAIYNRLIDSYGYCPQCADDTIEYVVYVLKNNPVVKSPKNEGIEWMWELTPSARDSTDE